MASPSERIAELIRSGDDFLVASHFNPDGDAIGSTSAMGFVLQALGKRFTLYNPSGMPPRYDYAPLPGPIVDELPEVMPATTIVLDCGAVDRMGDALLSRLDETFLVNIDHHLHNGDYGRENWVDPAEPAVGAMVAQVAQALDVPLVGGLAECVYLAYGTTTPESLELTADMLRNGLDIASMNKRITKQWSEERMRLWTEVMDNVQLHKDKKVALSAITKDIFDRTGTTVEDTENIINFIRRLKSVRVAATLREEGPELYKFSLRSYGDDNVQKVAARFGGGGHRNASGGTVQAPLDEAKTLLVAAIAEELGLD